MSLRISKLIQNQRENKANSVGNRCDREHSSPLQRENKANSGGRRSQIAATAQKQSQFRGSAIIDRRYSAKTEPRWRNSLSRRKNLTERRASCSIWVLRAAGLGNFISSRRRCRNSTSIAVSLISPEKFSRNDSTVSRCSPNVGL